jgi:tetratricopeptide (TPR) repeat protein
MNPLQPPASDGVFVDPQGGLHIAGHTVQQGGALGGFRFLHHLASGSSAEVVAARTAEGQSVALKILKSAGMEGEVGRRFLREVEALGRLDHPHVVGLRGHGELFGHRYIALELVEGRGFEEVLHRLPHLPFDERWAEVVRLTTQIADALQHIHRRGMVHRDLKPANLRVDRVGAVRLTDFGVAKELGGGMGEEELVVGTWAYASPEQVNGQSLDHRSDLYSLGVLLYQMLTGKRPFTAATFSGYTSLHLRAEPEAPRLFEPAIPAYLEAAALRLLRKAPRERFQSAQELVQFLRWEGKASTEPVDSGAHPLLDREAEVAVIGESISALLRGEGGVVMIEGPEGCGRTRLLDHICAQAAAIGMTAQRFDASAEALEALHGLAAHLRDGLGARCPPSLSHALEGMTQAGDQRQRLFEGVRRALNVFLSDGPMILVVDDLHHAPGTLGALLGFLARTTLERDRRPILLVAARRTAAGVLPQAPSINGIAVRVLRPGPLSRASLVRLVSLSPVLGAQSARIGAQLFDATEGWPLAAVQYLSALEEAGGVPVDEDGRDIIGENLKIPARVRQAAISRLGPITAAERELLAALAVAGKDLELEVLVELGPPGKALALIDQLTDRRVLVQRSRNGRAIVDFSARRLGQAFYWETPPVARATLHRRVALSLARRRGRLPYGPEVIGEHFRRAGDVGPAFVHLSIAALALWDRGLHPEAEAVAVRAEQIEALAEGHLDPALLRESRIRRLRVQVGMLLQRGAWRLALGEAEVVRAEAQRIGDPITLTESTLAVATALFGLGQADRAIRLAEDVLRGARNRLDRRGQISAYRCLSAFALDLGDLAGVERLTAAALQVGVEGESDPTLLDLRMVRAQGLALVGDLAGARTQLSEGESRHKRGEDAARLSVIHARRAELLIWEGELGQATRRIDLAERLAREVDHAPAIRLAMRMRAEAALALGEGEALRVALQALQSQMADGSGHRELGALARLGVMAAIADARWAEADERARHGLQATSPCDGEAVGADIQSLLALALIHRGRVEVAEPLLRDLGRIVPRVPPARRPGVQLHMASAWAALGYREAAHALASTALEGARTRGFRLIAVHAGLRVIEQAPPGASVAEILQEVGAFAEEIAQGLPPELEARFRQQPALRRVFDGMPQA